MSAIYQDGMWYSTSSCQVDVMPTPNETLVDLIVQYVGETTQNYKNGYFYKCVSDGESTPTYSWRNVRVQEGGGGGGSDVTVTQIVDSGTKIAEIDVDGTTTDLFSPKEVVTIMKNDFAALTQEQKDNGTAYFIPDMFVENNITVVEGYYNESDGKFYEEDTYETEITGETGVLYYSLDTDNKYKWDGEQFVLLVPVSGGGSSGAGGHIIVDKNETELSSRSKLQFAGDLETTDDSTNNKTIVKAHRLTSQEWGDVFSAPSIVPIRTNSGFTPIGTIISVMGTTAPANYLACNGQVLNIADYPELADYFEDQFGAKDYFGGDEDNDGTFGIPDLRGEFLRGTGINSHENQGSGANVGEHQDGTIESGTYANPSGGDLGITFAPEDKNWNDPNFASMMKYDSEPSMTHQTGRYAGVITSNVMTLERDKTVYPHTSRPTNTSVLYCIATKNIYIDARNDYSTTEKVVGEWIDGKPIYQKVITGLDITMTWYQQYQSQGTPSFPITRTNIDTIVNVVGITKTTKTVVPLGVDDSNKIIGNMGMSIETLIWQYTKTTD